MNKKQIIRFGLFAALFFVASYSYLFSQQVENNAITLNSETDTLMVEGGIIHLGNDEGNQGITFSKVFTLSDSQYSHLQYARLYIDFIPDYGPYYEVPPKLFINNLPHGSIAPFFPPLGVGCWKYWADGTHDYCGFMRVDLKISRTVLNSGNNTFRIDNGMPDDDYRFTRVMVVLFYSAILNPDEGTLWIAGEQDTIRWDLVTQSNNLILDFSTDGGTNWQMITSGVSADDKKYGWDIPEGILSTKCLVKIKDNSTQNELAVSETFKIKPYMHTRIHPSTGDFISYKINNDRWGFSNVPNDLWYPSWYYRFDYQGIDPFTGIQYPQIQSDEFTAFAFAQSMNFPDWVSWVRAFSVGACYVNPALAIYKQTAVERWEGAKDDKWSGSCFGIGGTNALAFRFNDQFFNKFRHFPNIGDPIYVLSDYDVIPVVNEVFTHQYGNPSVQNDDASYGIKTPTQTLNELRAMLREETSPIRTLTLYDNRPVNNEGAHTILVYKLERVSNTSPLWNVFVYDNSEPDDTTAKVVIDTSANGGKGSWNYSNLPGWGGPLDLYLEVLSENYLGNATLSKASRRRSPFVLSQGRLQIDITPRTSVRITDGAENITGFRNNQLMHDIPGSRPLVVKNPGQKPPYGYMMVMNNYTVTLDSFETTESRAFFFTGNTAFGYKRSDAELFQTDNLHFDTTNSPRLSVANPDSQLKSISLQNILNETTEEKVYRVHSLELSQNDSVQIRNVNTDKLKLVNYGTPKDYDLNIEHASASQLRVFGKTNISLPSNTTHTIEPNWDNLRDSLLIILVDVGNDGTIDDTLKLQNELTGVNDHGSLIPSDYKLYQNYPNPFNPTTIIQFDIPKASFVTLKVYNVIGQEVATLVNEKREAGRYEVPFDGSKLTSSVYFYRLIARDFVQTKKFILIK
jgi:hypothetical protein